jgi:hypothetical protein
MEELRMAELSDYSEMEQEIKDAPEPKVLHRGDEVTARIISVRTGVSDKNDARWYQPVFDVPSDPMVVEFNDFFWDIADRDKLTEKQVARAISDFQIFAAAIGLDYSRPFSWEDDLVGMKCDVILGFKRDEEYGDKNTVAKYVVGK